MCSQRWCEAVPGVAHSHSASQNAVARSPSRHDVLEQSRRKRSWCDYAKFKPDVGVDKRGGTFGGNKNPWIKCTGEGSNRTGRGFLERIHLKFEEILPKLQTLPQRQRGVLRAGKDDWTEAGRPAEKAQETFRRPGANDWGAFCRKVVPDCATWARYRVWLIPSISMVS